MDKPKIRVLIVDDEEMIRVNLCSFLEDEGYEVHTAESGERALEVIKVITPDVGIIDIRLPGINGNELILSIHQHLPKMQFIVHTGSTIYTLPPALQHIGISRDQVFIKPVLDMSILVGKILQLVKT